MSPAAWTVALCALGTAVLKSCGPLLLGGRQLPQSLGGAIEALAPAVLAALIVTQTLGNGRSVTIDERSAGFAVAAVLVALRVPVIGVLVAAAATTALLRAL